MRLLIYKGNVMTTQGSYLAWIVVSDLKKARRFFTDVLEMKELSFHEQYNWAEYQGKEGGFMIGVAGEDEQMKPGSNAVITLTVNDIVQAKKDLASKKVKMLGDIIEVPGHVKLQMFTDEDGNLFQLAQSLD